MVTEAFTAAVASLKAHEGFREYVYDDKTGRPIQPGSFVEGHPTIGYGWALNKTPMSEALASRLLEEGLMARVSALASRLPWLHRLDDGRKSVLYELSYNLGVDGLLGFPRMLGALEFGHWATAASELLDSKWARLDVAPARSADLARRLERGA